MFHRLPGEYEDHVRGGLDRVAGKTRIIEAQVDGLRHLGAGVAYSIESVELHDVRARLRGDFVAWLGPQDMQP